VAIIFEDRQLTYDELNRRANQLAHYLKKLGVGPEVLVALCMQRSLEMVVGMIGVLKAGGSYLPLDPAYPKERINFMLDDSRAAVILTQESAVHIFEQVSWNTATGVPKLGVQRCAAKVIFLDLEWPEIAKESEDTLESRARADNLAYVIYTSGSTGKPKGVMITHEAACKHMLWMQSEYPLGDDDCVLQKTPFSFDASIWEFYAPLLAGARVALAPAHGHQDSRLILELIVEHRVTVLQLVPSMLKAILAEEKFENCRNLKRLFCGGEVLTADLAAKFLERVDVELYNLYGPTEATIDATCGRCKGTTTSGNGVPIGRPIANTQTYILDSHLNPVPIGVVGELHIGGIGLARGYLNRRELTAEKFVANPFGDQPGARLYKTGDLARYLPDGNIEFLGRTDNQVKIRGFRIELGEIEFVLAQHPAIEQAVLLAREDAPGDTRLVAYIVAAAGSNLSANDLRSFLQHKLPDYMVPSAFVFLDSLPLTPNGKLDRKALPAPDHGRPELDDAFVAPGNPVEAMLANIWAEVLKLEKVGIRDNFFNLGGHSLLATQVVSRMRNAFSIDVPLRQIFDAPTIAEMAAIITENQVKRAKASSGATRDRFDD
jgi:amino acid adenylation domain-containing protein